MSGQASYLGISVPEWIEVLRGSDALDRRLAAHALGEIGARAREALTSLRAALDDPIPFVRVWAAAALARIDPSLTASLEVLIAETVEETASVRSLAAWHLGRLGPEFPGIERSIPAVRGMLGDVDPNACTEAAMALRTLEGKGAPPMELWSLSKG
jgi:HEAT repeat protein